MSSNNNDNGAAMGLAFVFAALALLAIAVYAITCFIAAILTIISILAWDRPMRLFGLELCNPQEARIFIGSGIAGAVAVPAFALFCSFFFGLHIRDEAWFYLVTGGYSFVSIFVIAEVAEAYPNGVPVETGPVIEHIPAPAPSSLPVPERHAASPSTFRFASWNDEAEQSAPQDERCRGCGRRDDPSKPVLRI